MAESTQSKFRLEGILHNGVVCDLGFVEIDKPGCPKETMLELGRALMSEISELKLKASGYYNYEYVTATADGHQAEVFACFNPNDFAVLRLVVVNGD